MRRLLALVAALALLLIGFTPPPRGPAALIVLDQSEKADTSSPSDGPELEEEEWGISSHTLSLVATRRTSAVVDHQGRGADARVRRLDDPPKA